MKKTVPSPTFDSDRIWPGRLSLCGRLGILVSLAVLLAGCGGGGTTFEPRQLTAISVQPGNAIAVPPGGSVPFSATGTFNQAPTTQANLAVQWASSDSSTVTIDVATGTAQCMAVGGPISISASASGKGGTVIGSATLTCQLSPEPVVKLDPGALSFTCGGQPNCDCGGPQNVTVSNTGSAPLVVDNIDVEFQQYYAKLSQTNTCSANINPGQSCTISVMAAPASHLGTDTGSLKITDSAGDSPQQVSLTGTTSCAQ